MKERKNLYLSMVGWAMFLAGALALSSCVDDELDNGLQTTGKNIGFNASYSRSTWEPDQTRSAKEKTASIRCESSDGDFSVDVTVEDGIRSFKSEKKQSRGTQISTVNDQWGYKVGAYFHLPNNGGIKDYFDENTNATIGGYNVTKSTVPEITNYYWPPAGNMQFFSIAPIVDGLNVPTAADIANLTITYTIPENVADQKDIMVANTTVGCPSNTAVDLQFEHLLAAVQFKVGKMIATQINSLTISGVKGGTVTMTYDTDENKWNYESTSTDEEYPLIYTSNGQPNINTNGLTEGSYITGNDNGMTMFVMPQDVKNVVLNINYTEQITGTTHNKEVPLQGAWVAGKTTTYVLNVIAETLQIEIPSPPDADAHYVRVDMKYDLSGLDDYAGEGITISDVTAKASWLDDDSNTASSDKQSIYMRTDLTAMQTKGYFTDELWVLEYSVDSDNKKTYKTGSANGPALVSANILGSETLNLTGMGSGTIYLFLDENDGTTDRNGELKLTATVTQNGNSRQVTLGSGNFKQLAPSWNEDGIGVERFEDKDTYPYGFSYNKVVTYSNNLITKYQNANILEKLFYLLAIWLFGYSMDAVIPNTEGMADGFVTIEPYEHWAMGTVKKTIKLDYGALNSVQSITSNDDGMGNTIALYNYTGAIDLTDLEGEIDKSLNISTSDDWTKSVSANSTNPTDYAAFIALTRNRMREYKTVITTKDGSSEVISAILHREGEGGTDNKGNESGSVIVEWYLPSYEEFLTLKETGTGIETTPISPLNGTYWSSTATDDPASGTNGYAYSYTYSNNVYSTYKSNQDRTNELKVRAVRKKQ